MNDRKKGGRERDFLLMGSEKVNRTGQKKIEASKKRDQKLREGYEKEFQFWMDLYANEGCVKDETVEVLVAEQSKLGSNKGKMQEEKLGLQTEMRKLIDASKMLDATYVEEIRKQRMDIIQVNQPWKQCVMNNRMVKQNMLDCFKSSPKEAIQESKKLNNDLETYMDDNKELEEEILNLQADVKCLKDNPNPKVLDFYWVPKNQNWRMHCRNKQMEDLTYRLYSFHRLISAITNFQKAKKLDIFLIGDIWEDGTCGQDVNDITLLPSNNSSQQFQRDGLGSTSHLQQHNVLGPGGNHGCHVASAPSETLLPSNNSSQQFQRYGLGSTSHLQQHNVLGPVDNYGVHGGQGVASAPSLGLSLLYNNGQPSFQQQVASQNYDYHGGQASAPSMGRPLGQSLLYNNGHTSFQQGLQPQGLQPTYMPPYMPQYMPQHAPAYGAFLPLGYYSGPPPQQMYPSGGQTPKDRKVLFFRKRSSERQQSKGVEQKHGRGKKRCCGKTKEGCGKGGRCCDGGSS